MRKGDLVIVDDLQSESTALTKFYSIVLEITNDSSV